MDDRNTHDDDELEPEIDIDEDDGSTPADTDDESDEPKKKADAEQVRRDQKKAWLDKIKSGKKTLDDLPENLGWLKKDLKEELEPTKNEAKSELRQLLEEERAEEELEVLIGDLQDADISAEQEAQIKEDYEDFLSNFKNPNIVQQLKALKYARKLSGLKDNSTTIKERRRKGMTLPPLGGKRRSTVTPDKETEIEKRLSGNLPPGFKA